MRELFIDLETFSSVDLKKSGLYKYVQSPDFEILLFAYARDDEPVTVLDLTAGELPDDWLLAALSDSGIIKHAFNAAFEINCLSRYLGGYRLPASQWRDTMLRAMYAGYPASLEAAGRAIGLPEDKQKLRIGKALIRHFCTPCAPSKTNGGRTRNLPGHDPEKWQLFKTYNAQDVAAEREIDRRLEKITVPDFVQREWETDLAINQRGVAVDMSLVQGALNIGAEERSQLLAQAIELSGLSNPNSLAQLKSWLAEAGVGEVESLNKDTVSALLGDSQTPETARRLLEIRQELGKTSTKKYDAIKAAVGEDGRVRGLLQFYGANRTGRWAGRLVQVQNLPRTYVEPLGFARELVKTENTEALRICFGSVQDTLSQLIRTAFVASPGKILIDADFSAIEARVISWLAGEQWRLEVFRTHGKIYEASASQMFGVPIELIKKGNPEYKLRQKGKVAELALGYQGGKNALITMGALDMGIPEDDLGDIVNRWREANPRIKELWYKAEAAAVQVTQDGGYVGLNGLVFAREIDYDKGTDYMTIALPSGRKLYYSEPKLGLNRFGGQAITFSGVDQTSGKWQRKETYGGKLVENIVQAIARDCLAQAITRLEAAGLKIVFHIHDEVVIDAPPGGAGLKDVINIMANPIPWAPGLPLGADGWTGDYFKKE